MEEHPVTCVICGDDRTDDQRLTRGLIVFCCDGCAPLVEALHGSYRPQHPVDA